jgi:hypothetical protein
MPSPQRISLFSILLVSSLNGAASWTSTAGHQRPTHSLRHLHVLKVAADSSRAAASTEEASGGDDFSSFAASLEQDAMQRKSSSTTPTRRGSTSANTARSSSTTNKNTWQADLERLLDPSTSPSQRQILLSDLLNANADIRASVQAAIRDRKVRIGKLI